MQLMENETNNTKLTPRQWAFYNFLKSDPNRWFTQKEICDAVGGYNYKENPTSTNDHCSTIGEDKRIINENPIIDKIIVMKNYCFKIATLEEYREERMSHINRIKSQVAQVKAMDMKFERDGQGKLFNNILDDLKESNEQYHETFYQDSKPDEPKFPNEINGIKVYTRVIISTYFKTVYIVTAQRIRIDWSIVGLCAGAEILLADGSIRMIPKVMWDTLSYDDFKTKQAYFDYKKERIV